MHTHPLHLHLSLATILTATCSLAQGDDPLPWFAEEALASGLEWNHVSGARPGRYWFPEIMGGGVALFDYDGDGDLDVYLVQSGHLDLQEGERQPTNRLFRNEGDGTFTDQTEESGLGDDGYGMGVACGDYDQDGDVDVYVTNVGPNVLYENRGQGVFKDVTKKMKVGDGGWGTSAAFLNIDGDADLDLFLVNNLNWGPAIETPCNGLRNKPDYCSPENYNARSTDVLFIKGRLGFQDSSGRYGMHLTNGNGLGVACADYDLDGDMDIYVA
ncbi:MAG: VCBS repeat-containing protein, partial [Planctomycetota bacterium]